MDFNSIYSVAFTKTIDEIDSEIISRVETSRKRNKNYNALSNSIKKNLSKKVEFTKISLKTKYSDLLESFKRRFEEYESNHLTSFFQFDFPDYAEKYSEQELYNCAKELGILEGKTRAYYNFSNSYEYLKAMYDLNKNYEHYTLNFDPNENPMDSDLFHDMQKERFPGIGQEPDWEVEVLKEIEKKELKEQKSLKEKEGEEGKFLNPGSTLDKPEKLYILHLLYQLVTFGSEMTTTEFLRILHLTVDEIDTSAEITGNPPNYRKVHDGFLKDYPKNKQIRFIENVISKIHRYQLPKLKQILDDKLRALTTK